MQTTPLRPRTATLSRTSPAPAIINAFCSYGPARSKMATIATAGPGPLYRKDWKSAADKMVCTPEMGPGHAMRLFAMSCTS